MVRIAVTGGIGSGKSVVCRILSCMGYPVYDCDSRAARLMDNSREIREQISSLISQDAIEGEIINRKVLSGIVFSDPEKLAILNSIVHSAVREDLANWFLEMENLSPIAFVETAILKESEIDAMIDSVWHVKAPDSLRGSRLRRYRGIDEQEFVRRSNMQYQGDYEFAKIICNGENSPLLPQIERLLDECVL